MKKDPADPAIVKARALFAQSEKSLDELGREMGYEGDTARKAVWQFLNKTNDPRLSMLRRFAKAMGVAIEQLVGEKNGATHGATKRPKPG